jgi:hypothetical protein
MVVSALDIPETILRRTPDVGTTADTARPSVSGRTVRRRSATPLHTPTESTWRDADG